MAGKHMWTRLGPDRLSGVYLWIVFIAIFGIWQPDLFLTAATLHSVASQQAIGAMLAIAILVPLSAGAYDLSIGSTVNLAAITVVVLQSDEHWGMWPAIACTLMVCVPIGVINGFLVVRLGVSSFIATLGMATIVGAVQSIVSGQSQPMPPASQAWANLTQFTVGGFQIVVLYLLVIALLAWWLLDCTPAGRYIAAIGGNAEAARLAGVRVGTWTWLSLIFSATLSGIAGVFYGSLDGPSLAFGASLLLPAFAAVFLGSTQLRPGRFNVWGTMIAVYVLATGVKGMQLVTGVQWLNDMFNGVALLCAVSFAVWRQRRIASRTQLGVNRADPAGQPGGPPGVPPSQPESLPATNVEVLP